MSFEDFLKSLIKTNQKIKLSLLEEIKENNFDVKSLSIRFKITSEKVSRLVFELNEEVEGEIPQTFNNLTLRNGKIIFSNSISGEHYLRTKVYLWQKYLQESGLFQTLLYILEYRNFRLIDLSFALLYSESYLYKLLKNLKNILQKRNYRFRILKNKKGYFSLEGNESDIRMFHYLILSLNSQNDVWLMKGVTQDDVLSIQKYINSKKYRELSIAGQKKINCIVGIYENAQRRGFELPKINAEAEEVAEIINREQEAKIYMRHIEKNTNTRSYQKSMETIYMSFFVTYFIQGLRSSEEIEDIGKDLALNTDNFIIDLSKEVLKSVSKVVYLPENIFCSLLYRLCHAYIVMMDIGLYKFTPIVSEDDHIKGNELIEAVEKVVQNKLLFIIDPEKYQQLTFKFIQIITGEILFENSKPVDIYIEFFKHPSYKQILEKALGHNFSTSSLRIVNSYAEASVLISDNISDGLIKHFYFESIYDEQSWKNLSKFLYDLIRENTLINKTVQ